MRRMKCLVLNLYFKHNDSCHMGFSKFLKRTRRRIGKQPNRALSFKIKLNNIIRDAAFVIVIFWFISVGNTEARKSRELFNLKTVKYSSICCLVMHNNKTQQAKL